MPTREGILRGAKTNRDNALKALAPQIAVAIELRKYCTYQRIADKLNSQGYRTRNGRPWNKRLVHQLLNRM